MNERPSMMPADTPDYMAPAWASCMSWALVNPDVQAAFEQDSGMRYVPARSGLDAIIDDATGFTDSYVKAFVEWVNVNVWGPMHGGGEVLRRDDASKC